MNGRKVLNELIKLFVGVNIILFIINYACKGNQYIISSDRVKNIVSLLEDDGIFVNTEITRGYAPKSFVNMVYIGSGVAVRDEIGKNFFKDSWTNVRRSTLVSKKTGSNIMCYTFGNETLGYDGNEIQYVNQRAFITGKKPTLDKAKSMGNKFIERFGKKWSQNKYHIVQEEGQDGWKLTYYPMIEGIPVMDSYIEVGIDGKGVYRATLCLADMNIISGQKQDIFAIDLVLFGIEDYMLKNQYTQINNISICYMQEENEENVLGQKVIPVYKIGVDGLEESIFVNAYTNEILRKC